MEDVGSTSRICDCPLVFEKGEVQVVKHETTCEHFFPRTQILTILVKKLCRGIERWASEEDGVHPDVWKTYVAAKALIGEEVKSGDCHAD